MSSASHLLATWVVVEPLAGWPPGLSRHAAGAGECVVSALGVPGDPARAGRVRRLWEGGPGAETPAELPGRWRAVLDWLRRR